MTIEIRRATSAEDLRAVFALRRDVFVGEGIVRGNDDELLFDVFDTIAETSVFVAVDEDQVIGSVRVTTDSELGFPSDNYFDFRPFLPAQGSTSIGGSMLCVSMGRRRSTAGFALLGEVYRAGLRSGATHAFGAMRPQAVSLVEHMGGVAIADEFLHPIEQVPVVPMVVDLATDATFVAKIRAELSASLDIRSSQTNPDLARSSR